MKQHCQCVCTAPATQLLSCLHPPQALLPLEKGSVKVQSSPSSERREGLWQMSILRSCQLFPPHRPDVLWRYMISRCQRRGVDRAVCLGRGKCHAFYISGKTDKLRKFCPQCKILCRGCYMPLFVSWWIICYDKVCQQLCM